MSFRTWIYHETKEPIVIDSDDFDLYKEDGWADSPAKFMKLEDMDIDNDKIQDDDDHETAKAQQALQTVEGVVDFVNGELNLDLMNKDELEAYAKKHFEIDLDKRSNVETLRYKVRALIDGDS